jgi:hypothetical protein
MLFSLGVGPAVSAMSLLRTLTFQKQNRLQKVLIVAAVRDALRVAAFGYVVPLLED